MEITVVSAENPIYSFHPDLTPVVCVEPNTLVLIQTLDALGNQITSEEHTIDTLDFSKVNPASGPVAIEGASPHDALEIEILEIKTGSRGIMLAVPNLGVLGKTMRTPKTKILEIDDQYVYLDHLRLAKAPMIGVIGVATKEEDIPCGTPGDHGGNMDTKDICVGSTLYLPVFQPGGMLALGDIHALMGDGEVCGTGVECSASVLLRIGLKKNWNFKRPVLKNQKGLQILVSAKTVEEASEGAVEDMVWYLTHIYGLSFHQAYFLCSIACDIRVSQLVDPLVTVRISIENRVLEELKRGLPKHACGS